MNTRKKTTRSKYPENAKCYYSKLTFLTPEQIVVLKKIHDTVKNSRGEYVTVGFVPARNLPTMESRC